MTQNRLFFYLAIAGLLGGAIWHFASESGVESYVQNKDLLTLETNFTADEIMEIRKDELVGRTNRSFQEPQIQFYPHLLLTVKYYDSNHKTRQGKIIWSQMDGEMVLNTVNWEQSRGFAEAIGANATPLEFRILNTLAENRGKETKEKLLKQLALDPNPLNALLDSLKQKQLIVIKGNEVILHMENPKFHIAPQTKIESSFVINPYRQGKKLKAKFGKSKIERIAKAAFGNEFTILETEEVYLPVIRLSLLNGDGSLLISDWNAITGNKIHSDITQR